MNQNIRVMVEGMVVVSMFLAAALFAFYAAPILTGIAGHRTELKRRRAQELEFLAIYADLCMAVTMHDRARIQTNISKINVAYANSDDDLKRHLAKQPRERRSHRVGVSARISGGS